MSINQTIFLVVYLRSKFIIGPHLHLSVLHKAWLYNFLFIGLECAIYLVEVFYSYLLYRGGFELSQLELRIHTKALAASVLFFFGKSSSSSLCYRSPFKPTQAGCSRFEPSLSLSLFGPGLNPFWVLHDKEKRPQLNLLEYSLPCGFVLSLCWVSLLLLIAFVLPTSQVGRSKFMQMNEWFYCYARVCDSHRAYFRG